VNLRPRWTGWTYVGWLVLAGPAIAQIVLLAIAVIGRFWYPYDLEWMEGGLLQHAQRISDGDGIYGPPSVEFIPYLYTPLYPGLIAMLGSMFGIGYQVGRLISILSLIGIAIVGVVTTMSGTRGGSRGMKAIGLGGGVYAFGLFAASYPYVDGWYDLVRADTLFLFMITGGLALSYTTARDGVGWSWGGQARTAAAAAILALAFFCKQTGVIFVAAGGLIVLCTNWRRVFVYSAVVIAIGGGGTLLLQRATDGWFWTYVFKIHQAHDWNPDRYWLSFENIARRLPAVTIVVQVTLVLVLITWAVRRRIPRPAWTFLVWTFLYLVSIQVGATSWATEFAHFNAYMPALLHGAIAAGCALPAIAACIALLAGGEPVAPGAEPSWGASPADRTMPITTTAAAPAIDRLRRGVVLGHAAAIVVALGLGVQCIAAWWKPAQYVPNQDDASAGNALVAHIRSIDGDVWVPSHPWYAHLAGKDMYVHRMGVKDVTARKPRPVLGLAEALEEHRFAAIFLDNRDIQSSGESTVSMLTRSYQMEDSLPKKERPRTFTGADVHPESIWVPIGPPTMPEGARVVFDFEAGGSWPPGWIVEGSAWGSGPVERKLPKQGMVRRAGGHRWITSMHGGDSATGTLTSPSFAVDGSTLMMRLGGGTDAGLRVQVLSGGMVMRTVRAPDPDSERFRDLSIDVSNLTGATVQLRLIDEATGAWGHLNVDEIWIVP
jgi:hypothetical protein